MINLVEAQKDTILGLVNEIYEKGEFICPTNDLVEENETVIGELTNYEKALVLAANVVKNRHNQQVAKMRKGELDEYQLFLNKKVHKTLFDLLWLNIKYRLGKPAIEPSAIGFRKDWQLVTFEPDQEKGDIQIHCIGIPFPFGD